MLCAATLQVAAQPGGGGGGGGGFGGGGFGGRGFGILTPEQRQTMNDALQNDSTVD